MSQRQTVTVQTTVNAPLEHVWKCWTEPEYIMQWNAASEDWVCPSATNDLRTGGSFTARMEAKDKSAGFDFGGTYDEVVPMERIVYTMGDGRKVEVTFAAMGDAVHVTETFEIENENSAEMQRGGWQAIMDNFKKVAEGNS